MRDDILPQSFHISHYDVDVEKRNLHGVLQIENLSAILKEFGERCTLVVLTPLMRTREV